MRILRVFISSTFDDFVLERDALQKEVFPHISDLCARYDLGFMPIDLRWGVTSQAQYDQKTMALCLNEVNACKNDPHPDFLILTGDRYGWVPLPYAIEQNEFETLYVNIPKDQKDIVAQWYKLDLNQIPASYILQKRENEFRSDEIWSEVEDTLRSLIQNAIRQTDLAEEIKEKYFTSATEQEFDEYSKRWNDSKQPSIFIIDRSIDNKTTVTSSKFVSQNPKLANFKNKLTTIAAPQNYCRLNASLIDNDTITNDHIDLMVETIKQYLEKAILREVEKLKDTKIDIEKELQQSYKNEMACKTIGRENDISKIVHYAQLLEPSQPLIIFGPSGIGKSTIMAKVIEQSEQLAAKVIYRFCGISKETSNTRSLWISILAELGLEISIPAINQTENNLLSIEKKEDTFEYEVYDALYNLKEKVIFYIDALDQLDDKSKCDWLPSSLPANVKIVISVLNDSNYKDDCYYFNKLQERISNFQEILPLDDPKCAKDILLNILKYQNRTLQDFQIESILQLYHKIGTPLYLKIIAEEVKHYHSNSQVSLANTQKGAIANFIENLSTIHHHEHQLVEKVFGYIYASQYTLTESILYDVLSNDDELMEIVGFNYAGGKSKKLPPAVWARLHYQISPFLVEDSFANIKLFHREFSDFARKIYTVEMSQKLLFILQNMINIALSVQQETKLAVISSIYISTLVHQIHVFPTNKIADSINFVVSKADNAKEWIEEILLNLLSKTVNTTLLEWQRSYSDLNLIISENLYVKNSTTWLFSLASALIVAANILKKSNNYLKSIEYYKIALHLLEKSHTNNLSFERSALHSMVLNNLSNIMFERDEIEGAIELQRKNITLLTQYYNENPDQWISFYIKSLINLGGIYLKYGKYDDAYENNAKISQLGNKHQVFSPEIKISMFELFSATYKVNHEYENALNIDKDILTLAKSLYDVNPDRFIRQYVDALQNIAKSHVKLHNIHKAYEPQIEAIQLIMKEYQKDPTTWIEDYIVALDQYSFILYHLNQITFAIEAQETATNLIEHLALKDPHFFIKYIDAFDNLAILYEKNNNLLQAKE